MDNIIEKKCDENLNYVSSLLHEVSYAPSTHAPASATMTITSEIPVATFLGSESTPNVHLIATPLIQSAEETTCYLENLRYDLYEAASSRTFGDVDDENSELHPRRILGARHIYEEGTLGMNSASMHNPPVLPPIEGTGWKYEALLCRVRVGMRMDIDHTSKLYLSLGENDWKLSLMEPSTKLKTRKREARSSVLPRKKGAKTPKRKERSSDQSHSGVLEGGCLSEPFLADQPAQVPTAPNHPVNTPKT
mmetsp:Transcript_21485/g.29866  ORF Transcript_21485/g.29866 Transcript_21485/m.29866 type:complete len:249 (+) Transcript_21485:365-1111(+)